MAAEPSVTEAKYRASAVLFIIDEPLYRRNNLEEKLARRLGVFVQKAVAWSNTSPVDLSACDLVLHVQGALSDGQEKLLHQRAAAVGKRCFPLSHRTSDATWDNVDWFLSSPGRPTTPRDAPKLVEPIAPPTSSKSVADDVAATEQLAAMYSTENESLKKRVAQLEKECADLTTAAALRSGWKVERERLIEENAKAIAERKKAVSELNEVRTDLTARIGAAEQERRGHEARANELRAEVQSHQREFEETVRIYREDVKKLKAEVEQLRLRPIAQPTTLDVPKKFAAVRRAFEDGVLSESEALAKFLTVAKEGAS